MAFGAIIPQVRILSAQRGILITRIPFFCLKFFLLQFRSDRIRTGTSARSEKGPWKAPSASEGGAEGADRKSASDAPNPVGPEKDSVLTSILRNPQIFGRNPPAPAWKGRGARAERR